MDLYRPSIWDDVYFVADYMREEDQDECRAGGYTPFDALSLSFEQAIIAYTLVTPDTETPAAIVGVGDSSLGPEFGSVWMLGTDDIKKYKTTFLRRCKPFVNDLFDMSGKNCLFNYTYSENHLHHAWLRWLGFKFLREVELPPYGFSFIEFVRLKG
jgi:hypothetical protein